MSRFSIQLVGPDGRTRRLAGDEPDVADIPSGLSWTTSMPGGFDTLTCELARRADIDYPDLGLFDTVRVLADGGRVAWEGRQAQHPASIGGGEDKITLGCVGHAAHLKDDTTFRELYLSRDLTAWTGPSDLRRVEIIDDDKAAGDVSLSTAKKNGLASLMLVATPPWENTASANVEAWFDAGDGVSVASVMFTLRLKREGSMNFKVGFAVDDDVIDETTIFTADGDDSLAASTDDKRFAVFQWTTGSSDTVDGKTREAHLQNVVVIGDHGLAAQDTDDINTVGYLAGDIIADVVARAAPALKATTGEGGTIQPTSFVVPHAAYLDPVSAEDVIQSINAYELWDWAVWEDRWFHYYPPDPATMTWEVREADGARLELAGVEAENLYNGVVVAYTDNAGDKQLVGPTDYPYAATTSDILQDFAEDNPLNQHGIRKWGLLDVAPVTTAEAAEQLGYIWLKEHGLPQHSGQIVVPGPIATHPRHGVKSEAWEIRAGDFVRVADLRDPAEARFPHRIIKTSYNRDQDTTTCDVDNTSRKLDALFERLGIDLVGLL